MSRTIRNRPTAKYNRSPKANKVRASWEVNPHDFGTCRCPICGANNAGRPGATAFGTKVIGRDEHGRSWDFGDDRRRERRLRRRREDRSWRADIA